MRLAVALPVILLALTTAAGATEPAADETPSASSPSLFNEPRNLYACDLGLVTVFNSPPLFGAEARLSAKLGRLALALQGDLAVRTSSPDRAHSLALAGVGTGWPLGRGWLAGYLLGGIHWVEVQDEGPGLQTAQMPAAALRVDVRGVLGLPPVQVPATIGLTVVADLASVPDQLHGGSLSGVTALLTVSVGLGYSPDRPGD